MKALICSMAIAIATYAHAQEPSPGSLPPVPNEQQQSAGLLIKQAGTAYNNAIYMVLSGVLLGGGLAAGNEDMRTAGAIVGGACFVGGVAFAWRGSFRLERAGAELQRRGY